MSAGKKTAPLLAICLLSVFSGLRAEPETAPADSVSWRSEEIEARHEDGRLEQLLLTGRVLVESGDILLESREGEFLSREGKAIFPGPVYFLLPGGEIVAGNLEYAFPGQTGKAEEVTFSFPPVFGHCSRAEFAGPGRLVLHEGEISHCDRPSPPVRIAFRRAEIEPGEYALIRSITLRAGPVPIFYLPRVEYSLVAGEEKEALVPFIVYPAHDSRDGLQLFSRASFRLGSNLYRLLFDYRGRRGPGGGFSFQKTRGGQAGLETYFLPDRETGKDRYRFQGWHQSVSGDASLRFMLRAERDSDEEVSRDLFPREPLPGRRPTFAYLGHYRPVGTLALKASGEPGNRELARHLPGFSWHTSRIAAGGGFYYSHALLASRLEWESAGDKREGTRALYEPEISLARPLAGGNARPFFGFTAAGNSGNLPAGADNRMAGFGGADLGWRLRREFESRRHTFEPSISFLYRPRPGDAGEIFPFGEHEARSGDRVISVELNNRLEKIAGPGLPGEIARLRTRADYSLREGEFASLRAGLRANISRFRFRSEADYHPPAGDWRSLFSRLEWSGEDREARFGLSHERQADHVNLLAPFANLALGEKTGLELSAGYDLGENRFATREITLSRRLHCWEIALSIHRDRRETGFFLQLSPLVLGRDEALSVRRWKDRATPESY